MKRTRFTTRRGYGMPIALAVVILYPLPAFGQHGAEVCRVPADQNGLIRGDRVPSGCVLVTERDAGAREIGDRGPYLVSGETLFFTPNPKTVVLLNGARLSDGRLLIPVSPPFRPAGRRNGAGASGFGPLQRHFEPVVRHFGPVTRQFGPVQRDLGQPSRARHPPPGTPGGR